MTDRTVASLRFPPMRPRPQDIDALLPLPPTGDGRGVNLLGHFRAQFGLGENARLFARALQLQGYPVAMVDLDLDIPHAMGERSLDAHLGTALRYPVNLFFVNPDHLASAMATLGPGAALDRYNIACWFWELEKFPDAWRPAIDLVDEVMVTTRFVQDSIRAVTDKPLYLAPVPLGSFPDSGRGRDEFGLDDAFTFLVTFDFSSYLARKNPSAAIAAFRGAFTGKERVKLLIKTSNAHRHPDALRDLMHGTGGDPRIVIRDDLLQRGDLHALQRCCDAYVSLHRAEGFGLGMAESMVLGKPVVATAYSGNLDFMTPANSVLIPYRRVPVQAGEYAFGDGQHWAEADIQAASQAMQRIFADRAWATALGDRARRDMEDFLSPARIGKALADHLDAVPVPVAARAPTPQPQVRP
jgi:glycosyltransferase involved in cell wall biosynthesis